MWTITRRSSVPAVQLGWRVKIKSRKKRTRDSHCPDARVLDRGSARRRAGRLPLDIHFRSGGPPLPHGHVGCLRSEEHTSELQSQFHLVCRLLLEKKNITNRLRVS